nr:amino acid ABC transporter permease [uncultured Desulfobulbus sp.]
MYCFQRKKEFVFLDLILVLVLVFLVACGVDRITGQLQYNWNWGVLPQFIFYFDEETGHWVANYLMQGLFTTLRLSLWAAVFALPLGLLLALARIGRLLYGRLISLTAIELLRNLPPLVLIFLFYFFLADQLIPVLQLDARAQAASPLMQEIIGLLFAAPHQLSAFLAALITLAVFESAYIAEIIRAGIQSIDRSQWEAATALGLTRAQCLRHVILPQAFARIMPPLAGQMISLIKDSAIVSVISIEELTYQGTQLMASTYMTIEVWLTVAALYFVLTFPCSWSVSRMERRQKYL